MVEELTLREDLWLAIKEFPKYIVSWFGGLLVAILTDLHITGLAITAIIAGFFGHSVLLGLLVFFVLFTASRVISLIANAIGYGSHEIAVTSNNIAAIYKLVNDDRGE